MSTEPSEFTDFESVMADYLERTERGETPDPEAYLRAYPQFADDLGSFFRNHQWFGDSSSLAPPSLAGKRVGPYEIESEIARGGMGVVYRARQQGLDRPVALKLISTGVLASREERRRFRIEAEAAARLHHPGIIAIHEIGSWEGYEYFSMTLVDGPTLQQQVESDHFDDHNAAKVVHDIARAVAYAHRCGIVHRDLKPDNILISEDGRPLITDFGLAKWHREGTMLTRTGQVLGTPNYMSPEQACGRGDGDVANDIYSLGAILYAMLTGRPPHAGTCAAEVLRSVLQDEPEAPRHYRRDVSVVLEKICLKAIRFEPQQRYATADALADDLDKYLTGETTSAEGSGLIDLVAREIRRDQHQSHFVDWGRTLVKLGATIFAFHVAMFAMDLCELPNSISFWTPRLLMLVGILVIILRARGGGITPRTVAERPVYSIWIGYLAALSVMNVLILSGKIDEANLFPIAAVLSGFGFIAMSGHIWGGAAILGAVFLGAAMLAAFSPLYAPLIFGTTWLVSLCVLGHHYRRNG
ncbi:Serine/threonine-protein kinase PrkC [Rubripirellula lacrimiformis]|uniref:non-specific serine/threonine protein kinase n=1 Tax=Rubripirellula lacrimiformis TaxID=1930273 RepID=A0A517N9B1_9BACT|nr:serine/threonine-protein kinase [Rubripirellula lacrimiformis]QDT03725.1 Serine/threonine-protein kinase PrkC [Rubripirellula lacrimiformis]